MTGAVTAIAEDERIANDGWTIRAERVETLGAGAWRALIGVRSSLKLLATMTGHDPQPDLDLEVEAWVGEPEESDGIAVIDPGDVGLEVARVPLCECGDRGCGNIGIQLRKRLAGRDLPALVDLLRALSWSELIPARSNVLRGNGLAAIEAPGADPPASGRLFVNVPLTAAAIPFAICSFLRCASVSGPRARTGRGRRDRRAAGRGERRKGAHAPLLCRDARPSRASTSWRWQRLYIRPEQAGGDWLGGSGGAASAVLVHAAAEASQRVPDPGLDGADSDAQDASHLGIGVSPVESEHDGLTLQVGQPVQAVA